MPLNLFYDFHHHVQNRHNQLDPKIYKLYYLPQHLDNCVRRYVRNAREKERSRERESEGERERVSEFLKDGYSISQKQGEDSTSKLKSTL